MQKKRESDKWDDNKIIISIYYELIINIDSICLKVKFPVRNCSILRQITTSQDLVKVIMNISLGVTSNEPFPQNILLHVTCTIKTT